ncbi:MAG: FAD-dependent oxidoreductase [Gammaproteobacteria bacterium]|nr:FAD-dependent oxidoreductase [Gammaproteobacteria bacterium]
MKNIRVPTLPELHLEGFSFKELFDPEALVRLDEKFLNYLKLKDIALHDGLLAYRLKLAHFSPKELGNLLIECARHLEWFVGQLFQIESAVTKAQVTVLSNDPIFLFKQWYVLREAKRKLNKAGEFDDFSTLTIWLMRALAEHNIDYATDLELAVSTLGQLLLNNPDSFAQEIEKLVAWCVQALTDPEGHEFTQGWTSFHLPNRIDYSHLVPLQSVPDDNLDRLEGKPNNLRLRDGFKLTDPRMNQRQVLGEVHYCVYCHKNDGDFCSKGFPVKKGEPSLGFKTNPLDEVLTGCPLEEKISEMHVLKRDGYNIGALAMVMVDNPMCPITGHRICNDCMKACIYQKQDPVNIPQTETGILIDVLNLPWGVEIYDLFTRWNPLRDSQWVAKPYNGLKVMVMGMGPAGFTLAHHLTMEGFAVVGADGLKIEPLPSRFIEDPIFSYEHLKEDLDTRILAGFGGVAEYGITVRWDKNFLKLIYITLSRRKFFQVFGGVRFGGTLTVEDAWELGFDHMAIAVGAGLPKELNIAGSLAPGMRQANDFLMALQLTGAAKKCSLANLQVQLPAVVIGGGLTGVDTATEVQAYYIAQVEKTLERYEILVAHFGKEEIKEQFNHYNTLVLTEFLLHGREVRKERMLAKQEDREPNFIPLLRSWGGVTIVYRRKLQESPAYTRNHEEVTKAFEEGIYYAEDLEPTAARLDEFGHVSSLVCQKKVGAAAWEEFIIPSRSIFVATGARPNIAYEFEHRGTFHREGSEYQTYREHDDKLDVIFSDGNCKVEEFGPFTSYQSNGYRVSFLGDTHPIFHGSVVKAVASGKRTYPKIVALFGERVSAVGSIKEYEKFADKIQYLFNASVVTIKRLSPTMLELIIKAPMATKNFKAGQFYRVQNFESNAPLVGATRLLSEGVALIGASVNQQEGLISLLVIEEGASTRIFATFKEGDLISLMGPTGVRSKIPQDKETVLIIGGRMASAHLRAIGPTLKESGNKVLYIGNYETAGEVSHKKELEAASDAILWITQEGPLVETIRKQDIAASGEFMKVLVEQLDNNNIELQSVNRVHVVGTHRFIKLMQSAKESILKNQFKPNTQFIASIYGPMQCMLKGVCAQCLQWQIDPATGKRTKAVFACSWQDQSIDIVDLENLDARLSQNQMQEQLTNLWLDYLFDYHEVSRI